MTLEETIIALEQEKSKIDKRLNDLYQLRFEQNIQYPSKEEVFKYYPNAEFFPGENPPIGEILIKSIGELKPVYYTPIKLFIPLYTEPYQIGWWLCEEIVDFNNRNLKWRWNNFKTESFLSINEKLVSTEFIIYPPALHRFKNEIKSNS